MCKKTLVRPTIPTSLQPSTMTGGAVTVSEQQLIERYGSLAAAEQAMGMQTPTTQSVATTTNTDLEARRLAVDWVNRKVQGLRIGSSYYEGATRPVSPEAKELARQYYEQYIRDPSIRRQLDIAAEVKGTAIARGQTVEGLREELAREGIVQEQLQKPGMLEVEKSVQQVSTIKPGQGLYTPIEEVRSETGRVYTSPTSKVAVTTGEKLQFTERKVSDFIPRDSFEGLGTRTIRPGLTEKEIIEQTKRLSRIEQSERMIAALEAGRKTESALGIGTSRATDQYFYSNPLSTATSRTQSTFAIGEREIVEVGVKGKVSPQETIRALNKNIEIKIQALAREEIQRFTEKQRLEFESKVEALRNKDLKPEEFEAEVKKLQGQYANKIEKFTENYANTVIPRYARQAGLTVRSADRLLRLSIRRQGKEFVKAFKKGFIAGSLITIAAQAVKVPLKASAGPLIVGGLGLATGGAALASTIKDTIAGRVSTEEFFVEAGTRFVETETKFVGSVVGAGTGALVTGAAINYAWTKNVKGITAQEKRLAENAFRKQPLKATKVQGYTGKVKAKGLDMKAQKVLKDNLDAGYTVRKVTYKIDTTGLTKQELAAIKKFKSLRIEVYSSYSRSGQLINEIQVATVKGQAPFVTFARGRPGVLVKGTGKVKGGEATVGREVSADFGRTPPQRISGLPTGREPAEFSVELATSKGSSKVVGNTVFSKSTGQSRVIALGKQGVLFPGREISASRGIVASEKVLDFTIAQRIKGPVVVAGKGSVYRDVGIIGTSKTSRPLFDFARGVGGGKISNAVPKISDTAPSSVWKYPQPPKGTTITATTQTPSTITSSVYQGLALTPTSATGGLLPASVAATPTTSQPLIGGLLFGTGPTTNLGSGIAIENITNPITDFSYDNTLSTGEGTGTSEGVSSDTIVDSGTSFTPINQPPQTIQEPVQETTPDTTPGVPTIRPPTVPVPTGGQPIGIIGFGFDFEREKKKIKKKEEGKVYDVYVKPQGKTKFVKVNTAKEVYTKEGALDKMAKFVDNTLSAQGKIVPKKVKKGMTIMNGDGYYGRTKNKYREFKIVKGKKVKTPNRFYEKKNKRIDTRGEINKVTVAQRLGRNRRRGFRLF